MLATEATVSFPYDRVPDPVSYFDVNLRYKFVNRTFEDWFNISKSQLYGKPVKEVLGNAAYKVISKYLTSALYGKTVSFDAKVPFKTVGTRYVRITYIPHIARSGEVQGIFAFTHDLTTIKRTEEGQRFLAEAGVVLASSLNQEEVLQKVAQLAVPYFADWCAIHLLEGGLLENGASLRTVATAHWNPLKIEWVRELKERHPPDPQASIGAANVIRTGKSELHPYVTDDLLRAATRDPEHLEILKKLDLRSVMVVPLIARGNTLGAITLASAESGIRYDAENLLIAETLASQMALAIDNARLYGLAQAAQSEANREAKRLARRAQQLSTLSTIAATANEFQNLDAMLDRCLKALLDFTSLEFGSVLLLDEKIDRFVMAASRGKSDFSCNGKEADIAKCPCRYVLSKETALYLDNGATHNSWAHCITSDFSGVFKPLEARKRVLGVIVLGSTRSGVRHLGKQARDTITASCKQIGLAIDNFQKAREIGTLMARSEAETMRNELISAISHELRNPLGLIKGYATTLLREDIPIDRASQREFLQIIDDEATALQKMIDDLLDASRLKAGRLTLEQKRVSLNSLLETAIKKAKPLFEKTGHAVELRMEQDLSAEVDPFRIQQVLFNLLDNASRYSEHNTIITMTLTKSDDAAMVSVADKGPGISPENLRVIFEPFHRGDFARRHKVRGAGLGLTICKGIIEAHGGKIWAESGPNQGTTFVFTLPLRQDVIRKDIKFL